MEKELRELTDQELLEKSKKARTGKILNGGILGFLIGISVYSTVKNGLGIVTFLPILFALFAANSWKKNSEALDKELKSRNLK